MTDRSPYVTPGFQDVVDAAERIGLHLLRTPLYRHAPIAREIGTDVLVKHENHLPTGAFKVRGCINVVAVMSEDERSAGVIAASTGNHGQAVAYAARLFGVAARVCVPLEANPLKVQAIRDLGAEVIEHGTNFDEARLHCEALAEKHGFRYIHSGDEPDLIAGAGTHALEIVEEEPDVEAIIVPIGGGSGAAGTCLVAKGRARPVEVIGVQSEASPSAYLTWKEGRRVEADNHTFAEGLATGTPFDLPQSVLAEHLDDFILVADSDIAAAQAMMIAGTRSLVEAAGAAPLAAALQIRSQLEGRKVALICSGGNATPDQLRAVLG